VQISGEPDFSDPGDLAMTAMSAIDERTGTSLTLHPVRAFWQLPGKRGK
jgi:hypothetical protein